MAIGFRALNMNQHGGRNAAVGASALRDNTASDNTAIGSTALRNNETAEQNTAIGSAALFNNDNSGNGFASDNTAVGASALLSNTDGDSNTADGARALMANLDGRRNTAVGFGALQSNTDDFNTAVGAGALFANTGGFTNTAVGGDALQSLTSGHDNTAIGADAGSALTSSEALNIDIGNNGVTGESSTIRIGSPSLQTATFIAGIHNAAITGTSVVVSAAGQLGVAPSSQRFKTTIKPMDHASEALFALNPVTFRYKKEVDPVGSSQFGLVAEEVEKVNPDLVVRDKDGKPFTVRYEAVNAMLLNEFLKEHRTVQEQGATITALRANDAKQEAMLAQQQKQIEALTAGLQKVSAQLELSKPATQTVVNNQ